LTKNEDVFGIKFWMVDAETKGLQDDTSPQKNCTLCRLIHHTQRVEKQTTELHWRTSDILCQKTQILNN